MKRYRRFMSNKQRRQFKNNPETVPIELHQFRKLINLNLKGNNSTVGQNSCVELFFSGKEALDSMYDSILDAKQHIHFSHI